jgi:hypothetical protein
MPYVHFESYQNVRKLKGIIKEFIPKHEYSHVPSRDNVDDDSDEISDKSDNSDTDKYMDPIEPVNSTSNRSINENATDPSFTWIRRNISREPPLHFPRTFSEYYYGTRLRKSKQVITQHFQESWPAEDPVALMVNQLWMLVMVDGELKPLVLTRDRGD